jgi:hypothetical protein
MRNVVGITEAAIAAVLLGGVCTTRRYRLGRRAPVLLDSLAARQVAVTPAPSTSTLKHIFTVLQGD